MTYADIPTDHKAIILPVLREREKVLAEDLSKIRAVIARLEAEKVSVRNDVVHVEHVSNGRIGKAPRGENMIRISERLRSGSPATVRELHRELGIGLSSVQAVLANKKGGFIQDEITGKWSAT